MEPQKIYIIRVQRKMLKMSFTTKDGTLVNTIFPKKNLKGHNRIFIGERNGKDSCRVILWIWTTTDHLYLSLYISLCAVNDLQLKPAEKKNTSTSQLILSLSLPFIPIRLFSTELEFTIPSPNKKNEETRILCCLSCRSFCYHLCFFPKLCL